MTVRAKMRLSTITSVKFGPADDQEYSKRLAFDAVYDQSIPEDQRFAKATPNAHFEMTVDNPEALKQFTPGKSYYIDFTEVP